MFNSLWIDFRPERQKSIHNKERVPCRRSSWACRRAG